MSGKPEHTDGTKRIAVVAIHGVGDHEPFASARDIGNLLSNLVQGKDKQPRYTPFTEVVKRIDVRPVVVPEPATGSKAYAWTDKDQQKGTWGPMDALAQSAFAGKRVARAGSEHSIESLDHQFMKGQLQEYKGNDPADTYTCLRLEGKRIGPVGSGVRDRVVHVYDMYWSDLSQLSTSVTRIFGELYQLLFHLGSVSLNNALAGAIHFHGTAAGPAWRRFSKAQGWAVEVLALPIPLLNLFMAAIIPVVMLISLLRGHLSAGTEVQALQATIWVLAAAFFGMLLIRFRKSLFVLYWLPFALLGPAAAWFARRPLALSVDEADLGFAVIALGLMATLVRQIVRAYDKRRPGAAESAKWIGLTLAVGSGLLFAWLGFPIGGSLGYPVIGACLNVIEIAFGLAMFSWSLFYAACLAAHISGRAAVQTAARFAEARARTATSTAKVEGNYAAEAEEAAVAASDARKAERARWTARLILSLTSIVFMTLTIVLWTGVEKVAIGMLPNPFLRYRPVWEVLWARFQGAPLPDSDYIFNWVDGTLKTAGIGYLPILLIALLAALIVTVWATLPSVWTELKPPEPTDMDNRKSGAQGNWLDHGFRFMRSGGRVLYFSLWIPPVYFWYLVIHSHAAADFPEEVITIVGTVVAGAAVGVIGFSGRLKNLAGGFRPLLRVMLDVDNWLREHPRDSNPTARICGRYVSLLRHISGWKDSDGLNSYDALVIIAHSQGTVITADLLRFIETERRETGAGYDPELTHFFGMPMYFFTMGCPLRQLYGLRFPFLYGWARNETPGVLGEPALRETLRVKRWVNAYRSGDYVGRYLWAQGGDGTEWIPSVKPPDADQTEFCIGRGAHVHYWDKAGTVTIAEELDRLIVRE